MITQNLLDSVQEHIDSHYKLGQPIETDGIDWGAAEESAHRELDKIVGAELVDKAIAWFKY